MPHTISRREINFRFPAKKASATNKRTCRLLQQFGMNEWNIQWKCKIPGEPFDPATVRLLTMLDGSKYSTSLIFLFPNKPKYVKLCIIFVGITKWWMNLEEKRHFCCGSIRLELGYASTIRVWGCKRLLVYFHSVQGKTRIPFGLMRCTRRTCVFAWARFMPVDAMPHSILQL